VVLFVAVIVFIYTLVASAIFIAAGMVTGGHTTHGLIGELLDIITDSSFILIISWVIGCLIIIFHELEQR